METDALKFRHLMQVLAEYGEAVKKAYKHNLTEEGHDASSALNRSVEFRVNFTERGFMQTYQVSLLLEQYWKYLEYGRGPGKFPPIDKIREWVRVKPVIPYPDSRGRLPSIKQLAFLIARKIAREGTPRTDLLHRTVEEINREYHDKIRDAFRQDLGEYMGVLIRTMV